MIWKALIVFVLSFSALTVWKSARNDRQAEAAFPPQGQILMVQGKALHVVDRGAGPVLLLLHGAGGSIRDMDFALLDRMAQTHRVIAFDRPGHGFSSPLHANGESPQEQANHILLALDAMGLGDVSFKVAGYSYGGAVALALALDAPKRISGLLLIAPVTNRWTIPPSRVYDLMGRRALSFWTNPLASAWVPEAYIRASFRDVYAPEPLPEGLLDHFGARLATRKVTLGTNARQVNTLLDHIKAMEARYATLSLPIEIVHGAQDRSVSPKIHGEVFVTQVPSARLTLLPGVGHGIHNTQVEAVMAALSRL